MSCLSMAFTLARSKIVRSCSKDFSKIIAEFEWWMAFWIWTHCTMRVKLEVQMCTFGVFDLAAILIKTLKFTPRPIAQISLVLRVLKLFSEYNSLWCIWTEDFFTPKCFTLDFQMLSRFPFTTVGKVKNKHFLKVYLVFFEQGSHYSTWLTNDSISKNLVPHFHTFLGISVIIEFW